ncbi:MAG TPA: transcriptional repressor [Candidatus Binataceae bacterium]|nr:transcriptional repressor [Candidatus Binataceae bacterium]
MNGPTLISPAWRRRYADQRLEAFSQRCHQRGLALTPQRLAVMRALLAASDHPRAESIFAALREQFPTISLATVHRTLETLCAIGEARKVTALHDSARYDGNTQPHHHLVCVRCRRVSDIEMAEFDHLLHGRERLGEYALLGATVEIQALCASCQMRTRAANPRRTKRAKAPNPAED